LKPKELRKKYNLTPNDFRICVDEGLFKKRKINGYRFYDYLDVVDDEIIIKEFLSNYSRLYSKKMNVLHPDFINDELYHFIKKIEDGGDLIGFVESYQLISYFTDVYGVISFPKRYTAQEELQDMYQHIKKTLAEYGYYE